MEENDNKSKNPGGRPTKLNKQVLQLVEKLAKLGITNDEIANVLEVSRDTVYHWQKTNQKFSDALRKGKEFADANIASRLYDRAMGFEHDSEEIKIVGGAKNAPGAMVDEEGTLSEGDKDHPSIVRVKTRKIYPPDTTAAIFWLKNRRKESWRDKSETGFTDPDGNAIAPVLNVTVGRTKS